MAMLVYQRVTIVCLKIGHPILFGKDEGNMSDLVMKMGIAMVVITMNWDVGRL